MIRSLTENRILATLISFVLFMVYLLTLGDVSSSTLFKTTILLGEGFLINFLCSRYKIIGKKNNMVLVVFTILSVLIMPNLSVGDLIYGAVWLGGFVLAFESSNRPTLTKNYLIYFGILLGVAQTANSISVLLFIPVFLLFIQTGTRSPRGFILSLLYFLIVVFAFICILYIIELDSLIWELLPTLTLDYESFDSILIKLMVPFILLSIVVHILSMDSYEFRFPNRSKILNFTMLLQLGLAIILILITGEADLLIYAIMASTILLSFGLTYKSSSVFVNAGFVSLICIGIASIYLYKILIL